MNLQKPYFVILISILLVATSLVYIGESGEVDLLITSQTIQFKGNYTTPLIIVTSFTQTSILTPNAALIPNIQYINQSHNEAHDVLLCMQTGKERNDHKRMRYTPDQIYFKTEAEMELLFPGHPELLSRTREIADKVNFAMDLATIHLPEFQLPEKDGGMDLQA